MYVLDRFLLPADFRSLNGSNIVPAAPRELPLAHLTSTCSIFQVSGLPAALIFSILLSSVLFNVESRS